tara:strand:- start:289 stop:753 length:465 start_codon:yes stop_codon:yes gene_type:complete
MERLINKMKVKIKYKDESTKGLFAGEDFAKGNLILILKGNHFLEPTRTSIQVRDKHIEHYEGGFLNHHCTPNAELWELEDVKEGLIVAKCDIAIGEEITFDYRTTESVMACPFKCDCHGIWIRGKDYDDTYAIDQWGDEGGMDYSGAFESDIKE